MAQNIALMLLATALSYAAGQLLNKRKRDREDKPTSLSERGSFLQRVIGIRRIGSVFAWAGGRNSIRVRTGKNTLGIEGHERFFVEDGWHLLCIGPAEALHSIYENGDKIFVGPITRSSHPSGSTIVLGDRRLGSFRIFWGENDQPINTFLGDATRVGVSSRWPGCCYIEWRGKKLGPSPVWNTLEYVIEVRTQTTILTATPSYMAKTTALGAAFAIVAVQNGAPGTGWFEIAGWPHPEFAPNSLFVPRRVRLVGNSGMADTDLNFDLTTPMGKVGANTRFFFQETITGATVSGTLASYIDTSNDGINPAHIIAELLFGIEGYGIGFNQAQYDMEALEQVGLTCVDENIRGSIIAINGKEHSAVLGAIFQDLGVMMPMDPRTGKLTFVIVREPVPPLRNISRELQLSLPEIEAVHGDLPVTKVVYSFSDRENNFRDMTLAIGDDGQATRIQTTKARVVQIEITTNFESSAEIVERRSQEDLPGGAKFILFGNRNCRTLIPGEAVLADDIEDILRVVSVEADPLSGEVVIETMTDNYAAVRSDFVPSGPPNLEPIEIPGPDMIAGIIEVPEFLLAGGGFQIIEMLRVRRNESVIGADIHISRDDTTYTYKGFDESGMQGGELIDSLLATGFYLPAVGPTITELGPDIASVLDLSADLVSWRNGRQLAVFIDGDAVEICFLKKVTEVTPGIQRLDGLIRARYDTRRLAWSPGTKVFIVQNDDGLPVEDVLLEPQVLLYAKSQPFGAGSTPFANITPEQLNLYGKGIRPIPVSNLRIDTCRLFFTPGVTNTIRWDWSSPRTPGAGSGFTAAGTPSGDVAPEGEFLVEILNAANAVIRTFTQTTAVYAYTAAQRTTDFGGEPASFKVRATQLRGGTSSDPVTVSFPQVA